MSNDRKLDMSEEDYGKSLKIANEVSNEKMPTEEVEEATEITNINDLSFDVKKGHKYIVSSKEFKKYLKTLSEKQIDKLNKNFYKVELSGYYRLVKIK